MARDEAGFYAGDLDRRSDLVSKSILNSDCWKRAQLRTLVKSFGDEWNFPESSLIPVWEVDQPEAEAPLGFVAFDIAWHETRRRRISDLSLTVNLFWVRPDRRGLGGELAKHLVSHFLLYLAECHLVLPIVSPQGVDVTYYADLYSGGGEAISSMIEEELQYMKDSGIWRINRLDFDVGF